MIDINTIITNAITTVVHQYMAGIRQDYETRIAALEAKLAAQPADTLSGTIDMDKLRELVAPIVESQIEAAIEEAMDDHKTEFDHGEYDDAVRTIEELPDFDEFVTKSDMQDMVEEKVDEKIEEEVDEKIEEMMAAHHNAYNHDLYVTDASLREFLRRDVKVSIDC